jgi:hypothetical protein
MPAKRPYISSKSPSDALLSSAHLQSEAAQAIFKRCVVFAGCNKRKQKMAAETNLQSAAVVQIAA